MQAQSGLANRPAYDKAIASTKDALQAQDYDKAAERAKRLPTPDPAAPPQVSPQVSSFSRAVRRLFSSIFCSNAWGIVWEYLGPARVSGWSHSRSVPRITPAREFLYRGR